MTTITETDLRSRAAALHAAATIVDTQGVGVLLPYVHLPQPAFEGKAHLDRAIAGGLTAMNTTMGVGGISAGVDDIRALLNSMYGYQVYFRMHADKLVLIESVEDIETAKASSKLGIIYGVQNIAPKIDGDFTLLWNLHKMGLRIAQLTHNHRNEIGSGCLEPNDTGLTEFGKAMVREMNRIGILVDGAHGGMRTVLDAIDASEVPIIVSHANVNSVTPHKRNATDEVIRALDKRGGVLGITFYSPFCQTKPGQHPTVADVVEHIAYVADLVGVDHVGIGSDHFGSESEVRYAAFGTHFSDTQRGFTRETVYASGIERVEQWPNLTLELLRRGFSDADVLKILGGNHMRIFRQAWK